jgi:hypothetical protein
MHWMLKQANHWWQPESAKFCAARSNDGRIWQPLYEGSDELSSVKCTPTKEANEKSVMKQRTKETLGLVHMLPKDAYFEIKPNDRIPFHTTSLAVSWDSHKQRYLAGYACGGTSHHGLDFSCMATSADGIRWTRLFGEKNMNSTYQNADSYSQLLWDKKERIYRWITRKHYGTSGQWREIRGTQFAKFTQPELSGNIAQWQGGSSFYLDTQGKMEKIRRQIYSLTLTQYDGLWIALINVLEYGKYPVKTKMGTAKGDRDISNVRKTTAIMKTITYNW